MNRVAIFASAFEPSVGGVEELTRQLVLKLRESNWEGVVCTNRWPRFLPREQVLAGVSVWRYPFRVPWGGMRARARFPFSVQSTLEKLCSRLSNWGAQLIHVQCVSSNGWYAKEAARILNLPLVVSVQGERTMDAESIYQRSPLFNRVLRSCLDRADIVTACSSTVLADLQAYYGVPFRDRGHVIYNGVGEESFVEGPGWPHSKPYLLALGRIVSQKGFSELIRGYANSRADGADLLVAGEGAELNRLKRLREDLGLVNRVHFTGRACRRTVVELIRGSCGLIVPSLREPMGIVALEGMAQGKPLLVSRVDGLAEIAQPGPGCRQAEPGDIVGLTDGINWLLEGAPRFDKTNQDRARSFLWSAICEQYRSVYENALKRKTAASASRDEAARGCLKPNINPDLSEFIGAVGGEVSM